METGNQDGVEWMGRCGVGRGGGPSKGWLPLTGSQWARAYTQGERGLHTGTGQSALIVILKSVISGLTSITVIILGTINLQFQGWFVPISLRPILGIVAAYVIATVWSSCGFHAFTLDTLLDNTVEDETIFPGLDTDVSLSFVSSSFALLFFSSDC